MFLHGPLRRTFVAVLGETDQSVNVPSTKPLHVVARTLRFLVSRYVTDPPRPTQDVARTNAARASATLRRRRHEREEVDAYLRARRR